MKDDRTDLHTREAWCEWLDGDDRSLFADQRIRPPWPAACCARHSSSLCLTNPGSRRMRMEGRVPHTGGYSETRARVGSSPGGAPRSSDIDAELFFCTEVLGLSSLHFGYWDDGGDLTLANLRKAQGRYAEHLIDLVPLGVERILDVGCGTGDLARALATRGHDVTAISPDGNHPQYFADPPPGLSYLQSPFERLEIDRTFDLILFAESQNYIDLDAGFAQCQRYLHPRGHLLVSGIFRREGMPLREPFEYLSNTAQDFARRAGCAGLQLEYSVDITDQVLPTLEFCRTIWQRYGAPIVRLASLWVDRRPLLAKAVTLALRPELQQVVSLKQRFDPDLFASHCRYMTLLFVRGSPRG